MIPLDEFTALDTTRQMELLNTQGELLVEHTGHSGRSFFYRMAGFFVELDVLTPARGIAVRAFTEAHAQYLVLLALLPALPYELLDPSFA